MASYSSDPSFSSSNSVQSLPPKHQVFINFRGKELRLTFVSHLEKALRRDGINVFVDKNETKGKDLSSLFSRIEESRIALAIFSSMYTESKWCLNELVKINECVHSGKLVVIPIFYKVDTDDVKNRNGTFGAKLWELAKTKPEMLVKWVKALEDVTEKIGYTLGEMSDESESIEKIVKGVTEVLWKIPAAGEDKMTPEAPIAGDEDTPAPLCGIEQRLEQLRTVFDLKWESTRTIGVVGMPGIGKTTLAYKLYEEWQGYFDHHVFLHDVRGIWKGGSMDHRNIFMNELLQSYDPNQEVPDLLPEAVKTLLLSKKSLVVLDNVSDKIQIELLLGDYDWISAGSRIIITTSDLSVIEGIVDDTYEVVRLSGIDSFQYFNYFAFGSKDHTPDDNFMKLSRLFVDYAQGNPFALNRLGVDLYGKNEAHWKDTLRKLEESPTKAIQDFLQISYDGLEQLQKDVFLDIACFFRSADESHVRCLVESCDTESIAGVNEINDLAGKYFINISGGRVEMHDLMYTFGKELGSKGSRSLWNYKGVVDALKKGAVADSVRGVFLDMSELTDKHHLKPYTLSGMRNLRYLKFYNSHCHRECKADGNLNCPGGLELPLEEIRYFYWLKFPLKKLPEDFNPKNLTDLNLPYSEIEELWEALKDTPKLRWVDLSHSSKLCKLSGLQNAQRLKKLNLEGCTSLQELPQEMKRMKRLIFLNMRGCTSLRVLPPMNLISLETLILTNCSSLEEFRTLRVVSDNLETLHLDGSAIGQLPTNMWKLQRLIVLNLKDCKMLVELPECLGKLKALQELVLSGCSKLKTFPIRIENMKSLQILLLDGTSITDMPKILQLNSSKVEDWPELRRGMNGISSLQRLCLSGNDIITNLRIDISLLCHLKLLDLKFCKNLTSIPLLPPNLEILDAHGCGKLKTVATPMAILKHMEKVHSKFIFTNCNSLEQAAKNSITTYAQKKSQLDALRCYKEGHASEALFITSFPGSEVPSWFDHRMIGSTLKLKFPPHWCDNRLSTIVLCAVVAFQNEINIFSIECTCEFKNELGTCTRFSCILGGGWIEPRKIDSDHVFIGYTSSSHITNHVEGSPEHQKCVPTEASIKFKVIDGAGEIVNCGLSLVYEEPNHVVIEGDCSGTSSGRGLSVVESTMSFATRFLSVILRYLWLGVVFFSVFGFARFYFH
ncbi:BnaA08g15180D [Brassica napus]|uniref:ADP-ribosyl cyclase/cyclic ADP-ribose hydrolase n=1 Tax=Brassica napus TaxID=3708 RepID=A0A078GHY7_BRANA|nr:BnaA08g15180D [Brassica napus]